MTGGPAVDAEIAARIGRWYREVARDLPWRRDPSPYRVLLSELMLQQTRVETVVPYFERFVARWPTLEALAAADEEEVLQAWAGLGYYQRARNLLRCARALAGRPVPGTVGELRALPGIGPYTAGAVASIAFGVAAPVVDGNVKRVVSRIDGPGAPDPSGSAAWARAAALMAARPDDVSPGALNQGLMELGATVCTPRAPRCGGCPVADHCGARAAGDPLGAAMRPSRKPRPMRGVRVVARDGSGRLLLGRRPPGLLGGLWEPVGADWDGEEPGGTDRLAAAVRERTGVGLAGLTALGEVTHVFTHRRLVCAVWAGTAVGQPAALAHYTDVRWTSPDEVPMSTLSRRILALASGPVLPFGDRGRGAPG